MGFVGRGMFAGFIATAVVSAVIALQAMTGIMPEMSMVKMLTITAHHMVGTPLKIAVGWILHFMIGTVLWGGLYGRFYNRIPGRSAVAKAITFSVFAWILMMSVLMPVAGKGLFGLDIGIKVPVMTLVLHLLFGVMMGHVFKRQAPPA